MDMRPALVTDSNSQIPPELRDRYGIEVVPITVIVDGEAYLEGVDLDADGFYRLFPNGRTPEITTSQPSPGDFVDAYRRCEAQGHEEIVSIHVMAGLSGTLNSARLAAELVDARVHLVDSGTASFGIACCVWEAALARERSAVTEDVVAAAEATAAKLHSVTAVGAAELLAASGRVSLEPAAGIEMFVTGPGGSFEVIGSARTDSEVCDRMADAMTLGGDPIRVALGIADESALPYYEGLEARLEVRGDVVEIVRYRIGPSVGAFTGPGTAGGFWWSAD